jgi:hypothetical protein
LAASRKNEGGGFVKVPLSYGTNQNPDTYLSDDGKLLTLSAGNLVSIMPYNAVANNVVASNFGLIAQGHRVSEVSQDLGNLGSSDNILLQRLSDGVEKNALEVIDTANDPRYNITALAYGAGKVIFSGERTSAPIGAVVGEIDVSNLYQGLPASKDLSIDEVSSSVNAAASVRDITPLPIIETSNTAAAPKVSDTFQDQLNINYNKFVGVEFSEFMNKRSVTQAVSLNEFDDNNTPNDETDDNYKEVPYLPFWIYKNLFLIADVDGFDLTNTQYERFESGKSYILVIDGDGAQDVGGRLVNTAPTPNTHQQFDFF